MVKAKNLAVPGSRVKGGFSPIGPISAIYKLLVGKWAKRNMNDLARLKKEKEELEAKLKAKGGMTLDDATKASMTYEKAKQASKNFAARKLKEYIMKHGLGGVDDTKLSKLARLAGGKFEPKKDLMDFAAGPLGWILMGIRKKRQHDIEKLRKQVGGKTWNPPGGWKTPPLEEIGKLPLPPDILQTLTLGNKKKCRCMEGAGVDVSPDLAYSLFNERMRMLK